MMVVQLGPLIDLKTQNREKKDMFVQWGNDDYDEDEPHDHNGNLGRKRKRTFSASSHIEIQNYSPSVSRNDYVLAR